jgi:hypothetical protein
MTLRLLFRYVTLSTFSSISIQLSVRMATAKPNICLLIMSLLRLIHNIHPPPAPRAYPCQREPVPTLVIVCTILAHWELWRSRPLGHGCIPISLIGFLRHARTMCLLNHTMTSPTPRNPASRGHINPPTGRPRAHWSSVFPGTGTIQSNFAHHRMRSNYDDKLTTPGYYCVCLDAIEGSSIFAMQNSGA